MIVEEVRKLKTDVVLDGELVWLEENGRSDFQLLQNAIKARKAGNMYYYLFDLLYSDDKDLTSLPLIARKDRLQKLVPPRSSRLRYSDHFRGVGGQMLRAFCEHNLEGIVSKRVDATYTSGRRGDWVKSKCSQRQEFVIGGFTAPRGARGHFGALLLGYYEDGKLRYAGRCGTGFTEQSLADMGKKLKTMESEESPFDIASPRARDVHWVRPNLVAEVAFSEWTRERILRTPVFHGLRSDKDPHEISIEKPKEAGKASSRRIPITHPDRIIYAKENFTKQDIADYYHTVAKWMLPHILKRPLSLVRCPQGSMKPCFFNKHFTDIPEGVLPIAEKGREAYLEIENGIGLQNLIQRGSLEIHPWNCHSANMEAPDQIVMDFDPGPGVEFERVKEGVVELKAMLEQLGLKTFLKTTGGKGLHIQFPFEPNYSWDKIKQFAKTLTEEMVSRHPKLYVGKMTKSLRNKKIFLDYLRNGRGATAVAPYSLRARPISAVAMPLAWKELATLKAPNQFTLPKALQYLKKRRADPWKDYLSVRQKIAMLR